MVNPYQQNKAVWRLPADGLNVCQNGTEKGLCRFSHGISGERRANNNKSLDIIARYAILRVMWFLSCKSKAYGN